MLLPVDGTGEQSDTGHVFSHQTGLTSSVPASAIYLFCMSLALTDELIRVYGALAAVEILKRAFINLLANGLA